MNGFIKICGITDAHGMNAALTKGADMVGLIFDENSPRFMSFEKAASLAQKARQRARIVAGLSDADDAFIEALVVKVRPDVLQLHGGETPRRVAAIVARFKTPVFKTLGISGPDDFERLKAYTSLCEKIVLEAKMPNGLPYGGSGRAFDWKLLTQLAQRHHIMLAGGLTPENVAEAISISGVDTVDVSSGVESAPGIKDEAKVAAFISTARAAFAKMPKKAFA